MLIDTSELLDHISLDCVVFGFHEHQLKVLLVQLKSTGLWALPGGFLKNEESIESAATRVLQQRTGLDDIFLKQFNVFSDPNRSNSNPIMEDLKEANSEQVMDWLNKRFLSVGFYALVDFTLVNPKADELSTVCEWVDYEAVSDLIIDHRTILDQALLTLRTQLNYQPIGYNLMPEKFTMPELQKLYETILGKSLDRRNFQRKILSYDILDRLSERKKGGAHKAPFLYSFNVEKYQSALQNGLTSGW